MNNWTPFHFESNLWFGKVESREDFESLKKAYPHLTEAEILQAKEATYNGSLSADHRLAFPNFGFRIEHDGQKILADFFRENGMSTDGIETTRDKWRDAKFMCL